MIQQVCLGGMWESSSSKICLVFLIATQIYNWTTCKVHLKLNPLINNLLTFKPLNISAQKAKSVIRLTKESMWAHQTRTLVTQADTRIN